MILASLAFAQRKFDQLFENAIFSLNYTWANPNVEVVQTIGVLDCQ